MGVDGWWPMKLGGKGLAGKTGKTVEEERLGEEARCQVGGRKRENKI